MKSLVVKSFEERIKEERKALRLPPKEELVDLIDRMALGTKSKECLKRGLEYEAANIYYTMFECPPVISRGKNATIWDLDGNEFIDWMSGFSVLNVGHCHPKVVEAIKNQCEKLVQWAAMPNEHRVELAKKLVEIAPGVSKKKVYLATTGGEAIEVAMRYARFYTGRPYIMAFHGAYHGITHGAMSATTNPVYRYFQGLPLNIGVVHVPYAYCYRCSFGKTYPECDMHCTRYIEDLFRNPQAGLRHPPSKANKVAAILVEPMQAAAGYITPPKEFLSELRRIADEYELLLIIDEIQTGWGRTGKLWACQHSNVDPDIMPVAKSIAGGVPLSAVIARAEIVDSIGPGGFMTTFGGTPLACATALATIKIFEEERLVERAERMGNYLMKGLNELAERHTLIGNITGRGLFIGVELVRDRKTKEPADKENRAIQRECMRNGLIYQRGGYYGNIIKVICPLTIEREKIDKSLEILDEALSTVEH